MADVLVGYAAVVGCAVWLLVGVLRAALAVSEADR